MVSNTVEMLLVVVAVLVPMATKMLTPGEVGIVSVVVVATLSLSIWQEGRLGNPPLKLSSDF